MKVSWQSCGFCEEECHLACLKRKRAITLQRIGKSRCFFTSVAFPWVLFKKFCIIFWMNQWLGSYLALLSSWCRSCLFQRVSEIYPFVFAQPFFQVYLFSGYEHGSGGISDYNLAPCLKGHVLSFLLLPLILILPWSTAIRCFLVLRKKLTRCLQRSITVTCGRQIFGPFSVASETGLFMCMTIESLQGIFLTI